MQAIVRASAQSLFILLLTASCNNSDSSNSTPTTFACSIKRSGELLTCNQFEGLSGTTLTSIQSECELRSTEGYSWAAGSCPGNSAGSCSLPSTPQRPSNYTQFYYGAAFSAEGVASEMCKQQGGSFNGKP